jgi:hypothetical protein
VLPVSSMVGLEFGILFLLIMPLGQMVMAFGMEELIFGGGCWLLNMGLREGVG